MFTRRRALALIGGLPLITPAPGAQAAITAPTLDELARPALARDAAMSPDGRRIAVLFQQGKNRERVAYLHLIDADSPEAAPKRVVLGNYLVDRLGWANNDRLLVSFIVEREADDTPTGSRIRKKLNNSFRRMLSIRSDGSSPILLFGDQKKLQRANWDLARVIDILPNDDDRILMAAYEEGAIALSLHHVDVNTGKAVFLERGVGATVGWQVQGGVPILRYDYNDKGTVGKIYARAPGWADWVFVRKVLGRSEWVRPDFEILETTDAPGVFLVATSGNGDTTTTIRRYDMLKQELGEIVAARPGRDMDGVLVDDLGRFVAGAYTDDRAAYVFADPKFATHFRGMESFFGKKYNVNLYQTNRDHTRYLAKVSGPSVHSAFYLYDSQAPRFQILGLGKPWLDAEGLARVENLDVKTRDGTMLRAYLTTPNAPGIRPLVVMPHGGPQVRDQVAFDLFAQAFAAQGWLVLQPNFRGSGGYGRAFAEAGHGHWGDRMQEDVEDAVAQVLATGRADPARVAICGASYGGYAALMGAVRRPELYKAAVSIAGVSDLPRMLAETRREDDTEDLLYYKLWVSRMGDPDTQLPKLQAASPALRAGEIKARVLLIHGLADQVVPPRQSAYMAAALRGAGKAYEHVEVSEAGHGGWDEDDLKLILARATDFIGKAFA